MAELERFTDRARNVAVEIAGEEARRLNSEYIGTDHILFALLKDGSGFATKILAALGADIGRMQQDVQELLTQSKEPTQAPLRYTASALEMLTAAVKEADKWKMRRVGTEHMLLALTSSGDTVSVAAKVLHDHGINYPRVQNELDRAMNAPVDDVDAKTVVARLQLKQVSDNLYIVLSPPEYANDTPRTLAECLGAHISAAYQKSEDGITLTLSTTTQPHD
jgi:ATP-dependent Clp protease ATP-binding subunit ClpA